MYILKIVGVILTIISSSGIGLYFSSRLKDRTEDLKELKKSILVLQGDIRYANTPLPEALESLAGRHKGNFKAFFEKISEQLGELNGTTFYDVWKKSVEECLGATAMNKEDKVQLLKFGETIGYLDKQMQINTIDLFLSQLEENINESTRTMNEKVRLYNLLGVMCGIFITIVMI